MQWELAAALDVQRILEGSLKAWCSLATSWPLISPLPCHGDTWADFSLLALSP